MRALGRATLLELKLLVRDPLTVIFTLALPLAVLYVLGAVFGNTPKYPGAFRNVGAMNYYVPAYIGLATASMGVIGQPVHLAGYRERGILKRYRASDVPLWSILGGLVASSVVASLASSLVLWGSAVLTYDVALPVQPLLVGAAFLLAALCFGAVGVLLGVLLPTARAAQGAGIILWFVMQMVSGAGPPIEVLTGTLRTVGSALPLRHVVLLIQDPWLGFGWNWAEMLVVLVITAGSAALALLLLRNPPGLFLARLARVANRARPGRAPGHS